MTPNWYQTAINELGTVEGKGTADNPRVIEYHSATGLAASQDVVPWCGSFVAWCFMKNGIKYRKATAARARDWLEWGKKLTKPIVGCIVVIPRSKVGSGQGHVGFFAGWVDDAKTQFRLIAGNQSGGSKTGHDGAVTMATFQASNVLGYRWPEEVPIPVAKQKLSKSGVIQAGAATLATGGGLVAANVPELPKAVEVVATSPNLAEKVQENLPVLVDAAEKAQSKIATGTIIGVVIGLVIIGLAAWLMWSRIKGGKGERSFAAE